MEVVKAPHPRLGYYAYLGDFVGTHHPPTDREAVAVLDQLNALQQHSKSQIYPITVGNIDASGPSERTQWWFRKTDIDPAGECPDISGVKMRIGLIRLLARGKDTG